MNICKQCGSSNSNGTNFCTRKCRVRWVREHNIRGGRKKAERLRENALMRFGSGFDNLSCQNEGEV